MGKVFHPGSVRPAPRTRQGPARAGLALLLLAGLGASCSGERAHGDRSRELLRGSPHHWVEQPGILVPEGSPPFGRHGPGGWARELDHSEGRPVAWSKTGTTQLLLPALEPRRRLLVLELSCPPEASPEARRAELFLNGHDIGWVRLGPDPETIELETEAEHWRRGDNVLEIRVPELTRTARRGLCGIGVSGVRYDTTRVVRQQGEQIELLPGTGVGFDLEAGARTRIVVEGRARGNGVLAVDIRRLNADGTLVTEPLVSERFLHRDELFEHALGLRLPAGTLLRVDVALPSGDPGSRLYLDRVAVVERAAERPPSIVLVSVDTLSARETSLYGHERRTTPRLDAFAEEAVLFRDCRANAPWTVPSYMSQLTGLYPRAHELNPIPGRLRSEWERRQLAPSRWTLAEALRARGYRTAAFVDNPWLARGLGFEQGFDHFDTSAALIDWREPEGGIDHMVPRVARWLDERDGSEPFFLFVQAFDPHAPYNPTDPWKGTFAQDGFSVGGTLPVGHDQRAANGCVRPVAIRALVDEPHPDEVEVDPIVTAYHEKVLQVDAGIARLFAELRRRGLFDTSIVIVTADHGESLVLHDLRFGHSLLYDDVMHVPFLVRLPGGERGGTVVEDPVQLVDLYPTVLELAGSRFQAGELHGKSLVPFFEGRSRDDGVVYGEGGVCEQAFLVQEGWKLVVSFPSSGSIDWQWTHPRLDRERLGELAPELMAGWPDPERLYAAIEANPELERFLRTELQGPVFELYYLAEDPDEQNDVAAENPDVVHALFERLIEERMRGEAARAGARALDGPEWTDIERARLDALGYLGD